MPSPINLALMKLTRRAEQQEREKLLNTFVDVGPLFTLLSSHDHQVIFGRRGTGKTHALRYLEEIKEQEGDVALYIDMRTIGSNNSLYSDTTLSIQERATRLLLDCCEHIYNLLFESAIELGCGDHILKSFDYLEKQLTEVQVVGTFEVEKTSGKQLAANDEVSLSAGIQKDGANLSVNASAGERISHSESTSTKEIGTQKPRVSCGGLSTALNAISNDLSAKKIWIILDEWSTIPMDLQPFLADLLRRAIFPLGKYIVKIGAIEMRCNLHTYLPNSDYLGIELGCDAQADINLDDFMVFGNDADKAENFFGELLRRHAETIIDSEKIDISSVDKFISEAFTQRTPFTELVRASEGVPRDAINITSLAAQKSDDAKISTTSIKIASKIWFDRDKSNPLRGKEKDLLNWLIDNVIGTKKARAFLLRHDQYNSEPLIRKLVDARVLHVLKRGISAQDIPGVRFDVYGIDYGCYVDLLATKRAPSGLFEVDDAAGFVNVPKDDYRSIRRAILDIDQFHKSGV